MKLCSHPTPKGGGVRANDFMVCDICDKQTKTKKFTRKQLLGKAKGFETKVIKNKDGNITTRKPRWYDKLGEKVSGEKYIYPEFEKLQDKHGFKRKTRICWDCINGNFPMLKGV